MILIGFNQDDIRSFANNAEFQKAIKYKNTTSRGGAFPQIYPNDVFTTLGKCTGLVYQNDDIYVKKLSSVWLLTKGGRLFLAYGKKKTSRSPEQHRPQFNKYKEFHWGDEGSQDVSSFTIVPPKKVNYVGIARGIMYHTEKTGDGLSYYIHAFDSPYPTLISDGNKLHLLGGGYKIEERGIVH